MASPSRQPMRPTFAVLATAVLLAACGTGTESTDGITVQGDVPVVYAMRSSELNINPTDGAPFAPGGDLMLRARASATAEEINLTRRFTQGNGDVSDPEVSYDAKKIVFAMRCPTSNTSTIGTVPACTGRWNVWEYDMTEGGLKEGSFRRITASTEHDDVDPAYLPANRGFVFSSNRQSLTRTVAGGQTFYAVDEYERERVLNLHTMDADGGAIKQISVNQSHDRNPVVRANGDIMFSRWEHVGPRNRFAVFRAKPDGTDMFVLYGAQSPGNSFLHPRDMDPNGKYKGHISSSLMSLSGTQEGGSVMFIDAANYSENNTPANTTVPAAGGQKEVTDKPLSQGRGLSLNGRATSPFPLWDGTDRVLVAWEPCQVTRDGGTIPCDRLTPAEIQRLGSNRTDAAAAADSVQDNVPTNYAIYMFDPTRQTWLIIAAPPRGFFFTDPVAVQARPAPLAAQPTAVDEALALQGLALIEVRSVYDTDGLGRMGEGMLAAVDRPAGCARGIALTAPADPMDTRGQVADLVKMKNPADAAYNCQPARFVRATRAVAPTASSMGMREAIGETDFEPQQILGYAPIEPDGSFKLHVPADTPLALAVVDSKGRGIQTHLNWIQVRPGERRTCDGCHSPRRGAALNSGTVVNSLPPAIKPAMRSEHRSGETLAALRTRKDSTALALKPDMDFSDFWADTSRSDVTAMAPIRVRYTGNTNAADDLATAAPTNGFINYPDHIQPLWTRARGPSGAQTCTGCHTDTAKLSLLGTLSGTGRLVSYEELLLGDPVLDPVTGLPVTRIEEGVPVVVRGPALVETMTGSAGGIARGSRLTEVMFGEELKAGAEARTTYPGPTGSAPNHATMLNAAEKRLLVEWMDLGGQYFNNVSVSTSPVRRVVNLSEATFASQVMPVLQANCATSCHQPGGNAGASQGSGQSFLRNRYVLTGSQEGDYNATLGMISNTCDAASNALLKRPSTRPHPAGAVGQTTAVLPAGSTAYNRIAAWIRTGCPTP